MKLIHLSIWASRHREATWLLIAISHLLLIWAGFETGALLLATGVVLPAWLYVLLCGLFALGIFGYPFRRHFATPRAYHRERRFFDALLLGVGILLTISGSNRLAHATNQMPTSHYVPSPAAPRARLASMEISGREMRLNLVERVAARYLHKRYLFYRRNGIMTDDQIFVLVLLVFAQMAGAVLIAYWTCFFACSGSGGLTFLVLFGGSALLVALLGAAVRAIFRKSLKAQRNAIIVLGIFFLPTFFLLLSPRYKSLRKPPVEQTPSESDF